MGRPTGQPSWLLGAVTPVLQASHVQTAYVIEVRRPEQLDSPSLLLVLGVRRQEAERAVPDGLALDITAYDPDEGVPEYLVASEVPPFYCGTG